MAMTLPVGSNGGGDFKRAPAGSHIAVCNLVADCGMQPGSAQYPNPKRKIYIRFEIPAERVEFEKNGKPVEGPPRCTLIISKGISSITARPIASPFNAIPGPLVEVIPIDPPYAAPMAAVIPAISSSA